MKKIFLLLIMLISVEYSHSQKVNMILEVNDKILNEEISGVNIEYDGEKYNVNYYPGDLILNEIVWAKIQAETQKKFYLYFNYRTIKKDKLEYTTFKIELSKQHLEKPYLIVNVYDFREKKYKKWYQYLTTENYVAEISCPNCGFYARMK